MTLKLKFINNLDQLNVYQPFFHIFFLIILSPNELLIMRYDRIVARFKKEVRDFLGLDLNASDVAHDLAAMFYTHLQFLF